MANPRRDEYIALRRTIRERGTLRLVIPPLAIALWAIVAAGISKAPAPPYATLIPLLVLMAAFESVAALHLNVERVGRYVQVFFEEPGGPTPTPEWETVSMRYGRQFPGTGPDPLFSTTFVIASLVNSAPALLAEPAAATLWTVLAVHLVFIARVVIERRRAAGQRERDLERFRAIRTRQADGPRPA